MTLRLATLSWPGTAVQVLGVFMLSGRVGPPAWAFVVMLVGSVLAMLASVGKRDWSILALNGAFTVSNVLGIWRWLAA